MCEDLSKDIYFIQCIGVDRKIHICDPTKDTTVCGIKILKKTEKKENLENLFSCYECTF